MISTRSNFFLFYFLCLFFCLLSCANSHQEETASEDTEEEPESSEVSEVKIAFIGDQGLGENAQAVLLLMQSEGADVVFHQGDFDYTDDPDAWDNQINEILGEDFPYLASIGNHDETEWEGYQTNSRTYLMEDLENQVISSTSNNLVLEKGKTFVFVSGLGGNSIREEDDELALNPWWASVYTETQGADYGALFCTFNVDQMEGEGNCYFKDINGNIPDEFTLTSEVNAE